MSKRPIYLPIELQDVFELIKNDEIENLYIQEPGGGLITVENYCISFDRFKKANFYIKQEYTAIEDQDVRL
ncbi:hypothetical protein [Enterococcus faecalis]|uniref:hypothetical protein n=1 Tax=Enterococcus faecalis TaxID=1351 RepID=UPI0021E6E4C4|nr:hypothetical protein [Enterococcus faecalis]MCV3150485.1 hypothetical protein [Enterococcus faecalis]MCV3171929.1 hypothetical protein [Enterococcus faecalis]